MRKSLHESSQKRKEGNKSKRKIKGGIEEWKRMKVENEESEKRKRRKRKKKTEVEKIENEGRGKKENGGREKR